MRARKNKRKLVQPVNWIGGKFGIARYHIAYFPPHRHYVSAFGGAASEILQKPLSEFETYNDVNQNLTNLFAVLRDPVSRRRLCRLLQYTPASRTQYVECLRIIQEARADHVMRAWAFAVAGNQTMNGVDPTIASPGSWRTTTRLRKWVNLPDHYERIAIRLRHVHIENKTWRELLNPKGEGGYDARDTFFYMDPPYFPSVLSSSQKYAFVLSKTEHEELLTRIQSVKGFVMICGYECPLYEKHLAAWRRKRFVVRCPSSPKRKKPMRTDVIWMNY